MDRVRRISETIWKIIKLVAIFKDNKNLKDKIQEVEEKFK